MNCILNIKERNILHVNGWCLKLHIDKIIMKRVDMGEGEHNEVPCISI